MIINLHFSQIIWYYFIWSFSCIFPNSQLFCSIFGLKVLGIFTWWIINSPLIGVIEFISNSSHLEDQRIYCLFKSQIQINYVGWETIVYVSDFGFGFLMCDMYAWNWTFSPLRRLSLKEWISRALDFTSIE